MPERPNIILIMTDQQRFDTIGAWGYDYAITPAMDRLAAEGLSFRNAFCPGATCIASRAAIFTGMYPHNTGVYSFDHWADHRNWVQDLNDAGYHCVNLGKMHFAPRDVAGGFHERVIVENPTSKHLDSGGADDDWGRYLRIHGLERPNDRNKTDPHWLQKYQGGPLALGGALSLGCLYRRLRPCLDPRLQGPTTVFLAGRFYRPARAVGSAAEASGAVRRASNAPARDARGRVGGQAAPARGAEKNAR